MDFRAAFRDPEQVEAFKAFVVEHGAELRAPTNEWELVRFKMNGAVNVIYSSKRGRISIVGPDGQRVAAAFCKDPESQPEESGGRTCQPNKRKRLTLRARLIERDGLECFYCGTAIDGVATIEHLLSRAHHGPNHLANLALAHRPCNEKANDLSVVEKVKLREKMRRERAG